MQKEVRVDTTPKSSHSDLLTPAGSYLLKFPPPQILAPTREQVFKTHEGHFLVTHGIFPSNGSIMKANTGALSSVKIGTGQGDGSVVDEKRILS